ncbi:hypothetical protein JMUB7525_27390 [Staphylococcus aureus]
MSRGLGDVYKRQDRRNMRIEFNPNKLTRDEMIWLKQNIISYMEDDGFTRLDLACLLYTSPSPRDMRRSRMPSSA